jgi:hypothetical protein
VQHDDRVLAAAENSSTGRSSSPAHLADDVDRLGLEHTSGLDAILVCRSVAVPDQRSTLVGEFAQVGHRPGRGAHRPLLRMVTLKTEAQARHTHDCSSVSSGRRSCSPHTGQK